MTGYELLYLASLITFTFGALTFSVLTLYYLRERRLRGAPVFPAFTIVCAAAFVMNLVLQAMAAYGLDAPWVTVLAPLQSVITGLLPPMLFHLVYAGEASCLAGTAWKWLLAGFYPISVAASLISSVSEAAWAGAAPALVLGTSGALGLLVQYRSTRNPRLAGRSLRLWHRTLLCFALLCAVVNLASPGPFVELLPDYLVLAFFCVTLYYKERLVFFDLLIKRGAFFAVALVGLTLFFALVPQDATRPWVAAMLLLPFWLLAPWIYQRLEHIIDRAWLRRPYSPADAERHFVHALQASLAEDELRGCAVRSLSDIFQTPVEINFTPASPVCRDGALEAELDSGSARLGSVVLAPRPNGIPFLSDDRRLLQSLSRTLAVVLENVRFREREQHLRSLASRAELKALRAQINPHFLFNALNAIAGLIPDQPELADETVERLAEVFRYTLRKSEHEWVRLEEEVEFITAYLRVEQARFGERLQALVEVDAAAGGIPIPAMTIQPLIENAIKHGVSAVEGPGRVSLRANMSDDALRIEVLDNGPGFPGDYSLGHGLRNVMDRLSGYYGEFARLDWQNTAEGTLVSLHIPRREPCAF